MALVFSDGDEIWAMVTPDLGELIRNLMRSARNGLLKEKPLRSAYSRPPTRINVNAKFLDDVFYDRYINDNFKKVVRFPYNFLFSSVVLMELMASAKDDPQRKALESAYRGYSKDNSLIVP